MKGFSKSFVIALIAHPVVAVNSPDGKQGTFLGYSPPLLLVQQSPSTLTGAQSKPSIWKGVGGDWKLEIEIRGQRIVGRGWCSGRDEPISFYGAIDGQGNVDAALTGLLYKGNTWTETARVTGNFPSLRIWPAGTCADSKLTLQPG